MMSTRAFVYEAIDSERNYQDARMGNAARETINTNRELGSLIVLMDVYIGKVKAGFSGPSPEGRYEALEQLRKVVALGVLAMETHGTVIRHFTKLVDTGKRMVVRDAHYRGEGQ